MTVPPLQSLNHCAAFPAHRRMRQVPRRWVHISSALVLKSVFRHTTSRLRTTYSPGGSFEVHFAIGKIPRVRVLSGSPDLTNLGTGSASFGFHAREKSADYGSRVGLPTVCGSHPLIRFVIVLLITTAAHVERIVWEALSVCPPALL